MSGKILTATGIDLRDRGYGPAVGANMAIPEFKK